MPPQRRRCATCRFFQSNQLSSKNGWCTHPGRQTSSDVRILVRTDELACRNSWGNDLWVGANGETPSVPSDTGDTSELPIPIQRRDDEVTSVVHRDAAGRTGLRANVVDRDDVVTHEASLFPERLSLGSRDDDLNTGAVTDQEHRAHVLARGGTSSAIQDARERMLARRSPQHATHADPADASDATDELTHETPTVPDVPVGSVDVPTIDHPGGDIAADAVDSVTPVETPIQAATPRGFGRRFRPHLRNEEPSETSRDADEDIYNSVPERDPSVALPLAQSSHQQGEPTLAASETETEDTMTVYDAVLQRAREFREATGRDIPVFRDDEAAAERRARRLVQSIPGQKPTAIPAVRASIGAAGPHASQAAPVASAPERARVTDQPDRATPRTQTSIAPRPKNNPRMGISLSDLKQQTPQSRPTTDARTDALPPAARINFRRSDQQEDEADHGPLFAESPLDQQQPVHASHPESPSALPPVTDDDYLPLEEPSPQPAVRRRAFGRLSNPWKRDRRDDETIEDRQTLANVREAIGSVDEPWDDAVDEPMPETSVAKRRDGGTVPASQAVRDEYPAPLSASEQTAGDTIPSSPDTVSPRFHQEQAQRPSAGAPTRSSSLYRPVHESLLHIDERAPQPDPVHYDPMPAPRAPDRRRSGNGATVLRVRADGLGNQPEQVSAWEDDQWVPEVHDDAGTWSDEPWNDDPEPYGSSLELQVVEPATPMPAASKWSFSPAADLDTVEGMSNYRGRLFGAASASRGERQPNDDLVVDIPTHAEIPASTEVPPTPVRDSPLRSANYRGDGMPEQLPNHRTGMPDSRQGLSSRSSADPAQAGHGGPSALGRQRDVHQPEFGNDAFDLRALLDDTVGDLIPEVSIAPDVPRQCQTCRDFRPSDSGERGFCANNWAFSHRQMVNAEDLPCRSSIGCWWLPSDAIWMPEERADDMQEEWTERRRRSG